jgi:hypothetical protein
MSFNRLPYDSCSYLYDLNESIKPGEYHLQTPRNDASCFYPNPSIAMSSTGVSVCDKDSIDVDSELMGLNVKATKCPSKKYNPNNKFCNLIHMKDCDELSPEETRMSNPPCTLRGTGWNRWEWLCSNPQDKAITPFQTMINNRMVVKDNHRPQIPTPMNDNMDIMPKDNGHKIVPDWQTYEKESYPIIHWRCCGEIQKL